MRSLNLDQLRTLVKVVELGSFSAAARQLHLTQPAVSLQIRELERRFGVKLVERFGKQAHPTEPGRRLIEAADQVFGACDGVEQAMAAFRDGWVGRVRFASTLTTMIYRLPPILRRLHVDHPGLELVHTNMPTGDGISNVMQNRLDLALVNLPVDQKQLRVLPIDQKQLRITPLCEEMLVAIFAAGTERIPDKVTPEFAARQPFILEHTRSAGHALIRGWLAHGPLLQEPMALGTVETLKTAVASNLGMAIVPEVAVVTHQSGLVVRPLRPQLRRTLALIEHRNKLNETALTIVRNAFLALRERANANSDPPGSHVRKARQGRK